MTDSGASNRRWRWLADLFGAVAKGVLLTVLAIVVGSLSLDAIHDWRKRAAPQPGLNPKLLQAVLPHLTQPQIKTMLDESYFSGQFVYAPYTGFKERPRIGAFVSVSPEGFRYSANLQQKLSDPDRKICLFGGSTMFGYGVDDRHTIAAYLQASLNAKQQHYSVLNFGRAAYFSSLEAALFQQLVIQGVHCDIALFMDGVNEVHAQPVFTPDLQALYSDYNYSPWKFLLLGLKRTSLLTSLNDKLAVSRPSASPAQPQIMARYRSVQTVERQLAAITGTKVIFVVQPVPGYRNAFAHYIYQSGPNPPDPPYGASMRNRVAEMAKLADGKQTFDLTGLFADTKVVPFLNDAHYTPAANQALARAIESLMFKAP